MVWNMIQLLFPLLQVFLPLCLYRKTGRRMTRFYMMMLGLENARRFYVRLLVIFLLLFHFVYVGANPGEYGVLLSTVLSVLLYRFNRADRWLHRLHESRKTFAACALPAVAAAFIPHLYTTAVTVGTVLLAALFYPSSAALDGYKEKETRERWRKHPEVLSGCYY
jgi:hypothetical protein